MFEQISFFFKLRLTSQYVHSINSTFVQNSNYMPLTDKQITAIHKLDAQTAMQTMHECAERLGLVTVDEYSKIMFEGKRTVYQAIKDKKKMYFELSGHVFPAINDK